MTGQPSPALTVSMCLLLAAVLLFLFAVLYPQPDARPAYVPPAATLVPVPLFLLPTPTAQEAGPAHPHFTPSGRKP